MNLWAHPDVTPSIRKELHYFQHHWDEEFGDEHATAYQRYFPRPDGAITGEWTPRYMLDVWTPARLRKAAPDARLLVLLRDPIERFRSGLSHYLARYDALHPRVTVEAVERGRYASQLANLTQHFPKHQILVLQLERCGSHPEAELERTYRFLGLDPSFRPERLHDRVYEARGPKIEVPSDFRVALQAVYRPEAQALSEEWPGIDLNLWPGLA